MWIFQEINQMVQSQNFTINLKDQSKMINDEIINCILSSTQENFDHDVEEIKKIYTFFQEYIYTCNLKFNIKIDSN